MNRARWTRLLSLIGLMAAMLSPHPVLARTPGPAPTPMGSSRESVQPPIKSGGDNVLHVIYSRQTLDLHTLDASPEAYVDLTDSGLVRLFNLYGVETRWSDDHKSMTLYGGGHYILFSANSRAGMSDGAETTWSAPVWVAHNDSGAVSLRALTHFLNFRLRPNAEDGSYTFVARIEKLELKNTADREITLHGSGPLDDSQSTVTPITTAGKPQGESTTVTIKNVEWAFDERDFQFDDVHVHCSGSGTDADPAVMVVTVPQQWKASPVTNLLQSDLSVRILPDFNVQSGVRPEALTGLKHIPGINELYVMMDATGPIKHVWRWDPDERLLTVDVPNATVGNTTEPVNGDVERIETEDMHTSGFPFARLRLYLRDGVGFNVSIAEGNRLTIRVAAQTLMPITDTCGGDANEPPQTGGAFIVIDPGHGGSDSGAVNRSMNLAEKDITLDIAKRLRQDLVTRGFTVVLTRESDRDVSWAHSPDAVELESRVKVANARHADLFLSIHCNASVSPALAGTSYHWYKPQDLPLAQALSGSLTNGTGFVNHGCIRNRFYVLRRTTMPAVLVETAFISNPSDARSLADPEMRQRIADDLAEALTVHFPPRNVSHSGAVSAQPPRSYRAPVRP